MFSAEESMEEDYERLLALSSSSVASIHFYQWRKPSLTYGYFVDANEKIDREALLNRDWEIARRPTGGGVILHPYDLAFGVLIPSHHSNFSDSTLENYAYVNGKVAKAIQEVTGLKAEILKMDCACNERVNFCMAKPTQYDVIIDSKKVAGAAQRRTKQGLLHQGSICLVLPERVVLDELIKDKNVIEEILQNSFPLAEKLQEDKERLAAKLKKALVNLF